MKEKITERIKRLFKPALMLAAAMIAFAIISYSVLRILFPDDNTLSEQNDTELLYEIDEAEKAAFFTRQLDISPEEAKLFWPVYNEFTDKRDKIVQEKNELTKKAATNFRDMTDKELEEYGDRLIELDLREAKLKSEYHAKFKEVLPAGKVVRLYYAERRFKTYLLNKLRSRRQNMPAAGGRRF